MDKKLEDIISKANLLEGHDAADVYFKLVDARLHMERMNMWLYTPAWYIAWVTLIWESMVLGVIICRHEWGWALGLWLCLSLLMWCIWDMRRVGRERREQLIKLRETEQAVERRLNCLKEELHG